MIDKEIDKRVREQHLFNRVRIARIKHGLKTGNWKQPFAIVPSGEVVVVGNSKGRA
jgi:hypothetical protein